jgi:hypothetical protein
VYAPREAAPLTGERNEASVLFSLAALGKRAPASPAAPVTESSALIDLRALVSVASKAEAPAPRPDDLVSHGTGAALPPHFAAPFAVPLAPPVTFALPEEDDTSRRRWGPLALGATALAVVVLVGVAALARDRARSAGERSRSGAPAGTAVVSPEAVAPAELLGAPGAPPRLPSVIASSEAAPPSGAPLADVAPASAGMSASVTPTPPATQRAAPTARVAARASDPPTVSAQTSPASPASAAMKCCPGESDMVCQMRLAAGAACSPDKPGATAQSAPPFDRPAAARALGISVASCKRGDGPTGTGHVKVTFLPSGAASAVEVEAPYAGTATGACVAQRYRGATVPAFAGGPLSVGKTFAIE